MESFTQSQSRAEKLYLFLNTLFCTLIIVSQLITIKLFQGPFASGFVLSAGLLTYPFTFIISDLTTEIFGSQRTKFMIALGFFVSLLTQIIIQCAIWLPSSDAANQKIFEDAFGMNKIIVFGSLSAYVVGQIFDVLIFTKIKNVTGEKKLWLRSNVSTLISQFIDAIIVNFIVFSWGFHMDSAAIVQITIISYAYKAAWGIAATPFFYIAVFLANKFLKSKRNLLVHA